jgi:hypothetical protein
VDPVDLDLLAEDRDARLESGGWMSVISPHSKRLRSRSWSVAMSARRPVGREDDLRARLVERVERGRTPPGSAPLPSEELDVVDEHASGAALLKPSVRLSRSELMKSLTKASLVT